MGDPLLLLLLSKRLSATGGGRRERAMRADRQERRCGSLFGHLALARFRGGDGAVYADEDEPRFAYPASPAFTRRRGARGGLTGVRDTIALTEIPNQRSGAGRAAAYW